MKLLAMTGLAAFACLGSFDFAKANECGDVTIARMNWNSAAIAANVDKIILEAGYGCRVTLVEGDAISTVTSMIETGTPDVAPEYWVNDHSEGLTAAYASGKIVQGAEILADGAVEGWWMPKYLADAHPEMRTVADALKKPELFADAESGEPIVHSCPADWNCSVSTGHLFKAIGAAAKGFKLQPARSAADLDAGLSKALKEKKGWIGYYWAPTTILAQHPMVKLSFDVPFDQTEWDTCTSKADCANPKINSYPISQTFTIMTSSFAGRDPAVTEYLKQRKWGNATISSLMAWQAENKASDEEAAKYFLQNNLDVWTRWLPVFVADKIKPVL
ncbi:glycine betaine ABC transporter substrate-binding protein [Rhizobium sp. FKY42]|uniref:glycine betaine ABC transporter substrate-binding protein n=1 Tax=Rhizobium sp. FKY42 TaxID=2562310 RepID=UPI0010C112FD|nr:glycine betaine ABC transporter substrate-binding protein [Rhizobium sp. FKY42]